MAKFRCMVCDFVYDELVGDVEHGYPAGTKFSQLPDTWVCPVCGVPKAMFVPYGGETESGFVKEG